MARKIALRDRVDFALQPLQPEHQTASQIERDRTQQHDRRQPRDQRCSGGLQANVSPIGIVKHHHHILHHRVAQARIASHFIARATHAAGHPKTLHMVNVRIDTQDRWHVLPSTRRLADRHVSQQLLPTPPLRCGHHGIRCRSGPFENLSARTQRYPIRRRQLAQRHQHATRQRKISLLDRATNRCKTLF